MEVSVSAQFAACAQRINEGLRDELYSRAVQVTKELRNAELEVLSGSRSGIKYKSLPNRSSAPGEPPAAQSGKLRQEWDDETIREGNGVSATMISRIRSTTEYATYLENGTSRMASRPFVDKIIDKAEPRVMSILRAPYGL